MKLKEYAAKEIFRRYSIPIPRGFLVKGIEDLAAVDLRGAVVKAQVLVGGRGKAGGIAYADSSNLRDTVERLLGSEIRGERVNEVLVEERLEIQEEWYLALTVDGAEKGIVCLFSTQGGMEVEEMARMGKMVRLLYTPGMALPRPGATLLAHKLYEIMRQYDAELVEINPLAVTEGGLVAADAKMIIDENALFRQPGLAFMEEAVGGAEKKAREYDLQYVELEGDIAVIGNGAGLVMATLDVLEHYGGRPANFLDVGGGAGVERMEKALEVVLLKRPKKVFINIFGGITRCDEIALGIVNYKERVGIKIPIVVRMIGTNEGEAKEILRTHGIHALDSLEEGVRRVVEL